MRAEEEGGGGKEGFAASPPIGRTRGNMGEGGGAGGRGRGRSRRSKIAVDRDAGFPSSPPLPLFDGKVVSKDQGGKTIRLFYFFEGKEGGSGGGEGRNSPIAMLNRGETRRDGEEIEYRWRACASLYLFSVPKNSLLKSFFSPFLPSSSQDLDLSGLSDRRSIASRK